MLREKARKFVRGESVDNPPEAIRLFALCEAMKWNHLPVAGGLYDQHPSLLGAFMVIFEEKAEHEAAEHRAREREMKNPKKK